MDLPPIKLEMVRLGLAGETASSLCRPATPGQLSASLGGHGPCVQAVRIEIVEPPAYPAAPPVLPPPLP